MRLRQRGLTLLEVMFAVVLFALGTIAIMELLHRAQAGTADGENSLMALHLAQQRMEELRNIAYASLADESAAAVSGFSQFCRAVDVTANSPQTNLTRVVTTVSWGCTSCASCLGGNVVLRSYRYSGI